MALSLLVRWLGSIVAPPNGLEQLQCRVGVGFGPYRLVDEFVSVGKGIVLAVLDTRVIGYCEI